MFGYPGDGVGGLDVVLEKTQSANGIEYVQVRHEEMAAFMASAHTKFTGEVGICYATSGPGATHLLTRLYGAKMDHVPVVAIVGSRAAPQSGPTTSRRSTCSPPSRTWRASSSPPPSAGAGASPDRPGRPHRRQHPQRHLRTAFHAYNVGKKPGGLSWQNLFYSAPLGAPAALSLSGALGFLSERVRDTAPGLFSTILGLNADPVVAATTAAGLLGTVAEAGLLHFRGSFITRPCMPRWPSPLPLPPCWAPPGWAAPGRRPALR